jgi:hypothetical protein
VHVVKAGFGVSLLARELLPRAVGAGVAHCRRAQTLSYAKLLTERQLEDAATPSPHASARALFRFQRTRRRQTWQSLDIVGTIEPFIAHKDAR